MKRTTVTLPEEIVSRLKSEARTRETSVSEVVRTVLAERFDLVPGQKRQLPFIGLFASGYTDTAERFEEYLAEVIAARAAKYRDR